MSPRRIASLLLLTLRRMWSNRGLLLGTAIGLVFAVTLGMSIPLYAGASDFRLLRDELSNQSAGYVRPPFAFSFRYAGSIHGAISLAEYQSAQPFFDEECPGLIGLPLQSSVHLVRSSLLRVYPLQVSKSITDPQPLDFLPVSFVTGLKDHVQMVEGTMPAAQQAGDTPLQLMILEDRANEMGLLLNEDLRLHWNALSPDEQSVDIPARIVGIWRPIDARDQYWYERPSDGLRGFVTSEEGFLNVFAPALKKPVSDAVWYMIFDGSGIYAENVPAFINRIVKTRSLVTAALAKADIEFSPEYVMRNYISRNQFLTILMYVFAIPIIAIILYFVVFLSGLVVYRQRNEIAVLRSRGAGRLQIIGIYLFERLLLGALAMGAGLILGQVVALTMGSVQSFLLFEPSTKLAIHVSRQALVLGGAGIAVSLLASLAPALGAAGESIISHKQDLGRSLHKPLWQRLFLDVGLFVIALYGYYTLRARGTLSFQNQSVSVAQRVNQVLGQAASKASGDPFSNPLLFLAPAVFVFALSLFLVRLVPILLEIASRVSIAPLPVVLALRQLGRSQQQYRGPLLLVVLTIGLAGFTATMAETLDQGLHDSAYFDVGADLRVREAGEAKPALAAGGFDSPGMPTASSGTPQAKEYANFLPLADHLKVAGIQNAARLGTFSAQVELGSRTVRAVVAGVDRVDFQNVAFFRRDFAAGDLGDLMNRLAMDESAALVPASLLSANGLAVGDIIKVRVVAGSDAAEVPFMIAGLIDLFPTIYPEDGAFLVANLDYIFERLGAEYPHDVLLKTVPGSNTTDIIAGLSALGIDITAWKDAPTIIETERTRPERQGILGLLSVGFIVSALLTALGYLFYALLSLERRAVEMGVLRALGLSQRQMAACIAVEQTILIGVSLLAGTVVGIATSKLFIPFLQVRSGAHAETPPFVVNIAWTDLGAVYIVFAVIFVLALAYLMWALGRMRMSNALKIGETI